MLNSGRTILTLGLMLIGASVSTASLADLFLVSLRTLPSAARSGSGVLGVARGVPADVEVGGASPSPGGGVVVSPMRSFTSLFISSRSLVRGSAFEGDAPVGLKGITLKR